MTVTGEGEQISGVPYGPNSRNIEKMRIKTEHQKTKIAHWRRTNTLNLVLTHV